MGRGAEACDLQWVRCLSIALSVYNGRASQPYSRTIFPQEQYPKLMYCCCVCSRSGEHANTMLWLLLRGAEQWRGDSTLALTRIELFIFGVYRCQPWRSVVLVLQGNRTNTTETMLYPSCST